MDPLPWLRLTLAPLLSHRDQLVLLGAFGSPEQVFTATRREVASTVGDSMARALEKEAEPARIDAALKWISESNHALVPIGEAAYPSALMQTADPPIALYVEGRLDLLGKGGIAIVGSRNATAQGARDAESFAHALSAAGQTIISGLALGVDAAAHRGGLRAKGSSIAVMGTGADRIYPPRNEELARRLAADGALISEFPLGTPPLAGNFPRRNRLISGLSRGVLVVEAALNSGSLITARFAAEQNRDVFAIPGSIHSPVSKGCHRLIKEGAKLVDDAADILVELGIEHSERKPPVARPDEKCDALLDAMGGGPVSIDEVAARSGESAAMVAARLSAFELEGRIAPLGGGLFQRLQRA